MSAFHSKCFCYNASYCSADGYCRGYGVASGVDGVKGPCRPQAVNKRAKAVKQKVYFMFNSRVKLYDYIKYFVFATGLFFSGDTYCGELFKKISEYDFASLKSSDKNEKSNETQEKISVPWSDSRNCIIGGWKFWGDIRSADGEEFTIESFSGNVIILVFSTTWCPNCPQVIQQLDAVKSRLQAKKINNIQIIHLNIGNESIAEVKNHLKQMKVSLDTWQSIPSDAVEISVIPSVLIFDKKGQKLCGYIGGGFNYLSDEFLKFIVKLSKQ